MEDYGQLCFTGKFSQTVDAKRRVTIPAFFLTQISDKTFHITRGPDKNLFVFPREIFIRKAAKLNKHFGSRGEKDKEKRLYFLETLGDAQPVQCDQQGRITVPQEFLDYAKIMDRILIVGAYNKFVFWNPKLLEAFKSSSQYSEQQRVGQFSWAEEDE